MKHILATLAAAIALLLLVLSQITIRTDMAEFLPAGTTPAARLVLDEARQGTATGLILIAIEGAPTPELARLATHLATTLPTTGLFALVAGGPPDPAAQTLLFTHRYALAPPKPSPNPPSAPISNASSPSSAAASPPSPCNTASPTPPEPSPPSSANGPASPASASSTAPGSAARTDGATDRALLLARTAAGAMDIPAQQAATQAIRQAFAAARPGPARLLLAGPAIFAQDAAHAIRTDVERISILSTLLVLALLWWRFRNPIVLAAIAAPVVASVAIAALAVQALFGTVHGIAIGFGATMLGVSVDYPVLMIGHRKGGEPAPHTRARIGRAFLLAVAAAVLGLAAMVASPFPGLAQLGTFAATGLVACAVLTWTQLPRLIVRADLAPVDAGNPAWLTRLESLRRHRTWTTLPIAAAITLLALHGVHWEADLQALSPVPAASLALDRELRTELGAPDPGQLLLVQGPTAEDVLQRQERLLPILDRLKSEGALASADLAATILPSAATQRARAAALPDATTLAATVQAASTGLPFRPAALQPFQDAVAAARTATPLTPDDLAATPLAARLAPLLLQRPEGWTGPIALQGVTDPAAIQTAIGTQALHLDMRRELGTILAQGTNAAWAWLAASAVATMLLLTAGLRDPARMLRVTASVAAALLVTVATLAATGARLSLIHLVALQLVAGVGLDYALFFARRQLDTEERARTLRTLVTCNAMTLLTFGLLAACQTPLLRDIGITVALGALSAMAFAFLIAGKAPEERE